MSETVNNKDNSDDANKMICTSVQPCGSKQEQFSKRDSVPRIDQIEFQDLIQNIKTGDYCSMFLKLGTRFLPDCYYSTECKEKHEDGIPTGMDYFTNTSIYNMLQQPLEHWSDHVDFDAAIKMVISHSKYLSGDILRILFDYILIGPSEQMMESITDIIKQHLVHHPPCLIELRKYYKHFLFEPDDECYFKTELSKTGVLLHVLHKLEEMEKSLSNVTVPEPAVEPTVEMTLEMLEDRWNKFQPIVEPECNETLAVINGWGEYFTSNATNVLNEHKLFERLIIALESNVNILECDFLICVGKLKTYLDKGQNGSQNSHQIIIPIIQCFSYSHFGKVLSIYKNTKEKPVWIQLSRLIGLMIETEHVFADGQKTEWHYPNLNSKCLNWVDELIKAFTTSEWDNDEKMKRLKLLPQAWLRQRLAMACCNAEVKADFGLDLKAIVELIHMHVKSPISLEKESLKVKTDFKLPDEDISKLSKKAKRKNQYGESLLIKLCRDKKGRLSNLANVLNMPDCDINETDYYGWTPLHEAVHKNSIMAVKLLLQHKQSPGKKPLNIVAQNKEGLTPLHDAVFNKNLQICELLLDYGGVSLLRVANSQGVTPLDLAKGKPEIQHLFQEKMRIQERLNLSPDSVLYLPDHLILTLKLAFNAFNEVYHTTNMHGILKHKIPFKKVESSNALVFNYNTILEYKNHQDQFRRLRRIISNLAKNPQNSYFIKVWDSQLTKVSNERVNQ